MSLSIRKMMKDIVKCVSGGVKESAQTKNANMPMWANNRNMALNQLQQSKQKFPPVKMALIATGSRKAGAVITIQEWGYRSPG